MALSNLENRKKQDSTMPRTAEDAIRRIPNTDEIVITSKQIKMEGYTTINGGFNIDENGNMTCNNATINNAIMNTIRNSEEACLEYRDNDTAESLQSSLYTGILELYNFHDIGDTQAVVEPQVRLYWSSTGDSTTVGASGIITGGEISSVNGVCQGSREEIKKNFEKLDNALDLIKDIDIYKYNLKTESNGDKKHIGFVIGDNYKYKREITDKQNKGVDLYSFISLCCKAIQEQQAEIEELKKKVNK